jgi:Tetracyclin repressor-like, C-terminal domain
LYLSPEHLKQIQIQERVVFDVYRNCLREIQLKGGLQDMDPTVTAFNILGAINWLYHWYRENGELGFEPIREATLAFIRGGIGGGGPLAALTQQETISREHRPRRVPVEG